MTIYYLMVKTHNITGLKYLCQTKRKDPHKYLGSGKHWAWHINKHGRSITTEILRECQTKEELNEWGLHFSELWNVVDSDEWANLKPENGDGGFGKLSTETIMKGVAVRRANGSYNTKPESVVRRLESMRINGTLNNQTSESIAKQLHTKNTRGTTNKGRKHSMEELMKMRNSHLGSKNASSKLTESQVIVILTSTDSIKSLSIQFGVSISLIYKIKSNSAWTHVSAQNTPSAMPNRSSNAT